MLRGIDVAQHEARSMMLEARAIEEARRGHFGQAAMLQTCSNIQHAEAVGAAISPYHRHYHPGLGMVAAETAVVGASMAAGAAMGAAAAYAVTPPRRTVVVAPTPVPYPVPVVPPAMPPVGYPGTYPPYGSYPPAYPPRPMPPTSYPPYSSYPSSYPSAPPPPYAPY